MYFTSVLCMHSLEEGVCKQFTTLHYNDVDFGLNSFYLLKNYMLHIQFVVSAGFGNQSKDLF